MNSSRFPNMLYASLFPRPWHTPFLLPDTPPLASPPPPVANFQSPLQSQFDVTASGRPSQTPQIWVICWQYAALYSTPITPSGPTTTVLKSPVHLVACLPVFTIRLWVHESKNSKIILPHCLPVPSTVPGTRQAVKLGFNVLQYQLVCCLKEITLVFRGLFS